MACSGVCVFEWRYGSREMRGLLSRERLLDAMKHVEAVLLEALEEAGIASRGAAEELKRVLGAVGAGEVYRVEAERTGHDVAALVWLLAERAGGEAARWVHFGATSNDIIDTAWALVLREALALIRGRLRAVVEKLSQLALEHAETLMVGRTHGQHALPLTLGFKLANYVYELARSYERLCCLEERLVRAKIGGAVGTMAAWGERGLLVRRLVAEKLGIDYHPVSTQVAPRDGYAELASTLAILASQLDRFATEVRELARPEIMEAWEERGRAIGSSAMPQKRNPVTAERITGLARVARSLVHAMLENIVLWHERDLSNSSAERIILPHILLTVDQALLDMLELLERLRFNPGRMEENLALTHYTVMAEALLNELVRKGFRREEAYELSRKAARKAVEEAKPLWDAALEVEEIARAIPAERLRKILDPRSYTGPVKQLITEALEYSDRALEKC